MDASSLDAIAASASVCTLRPRGFLDLNARAADAVLGVVSGACAISALAPNGAAVTLYRLEQGASYGIERVLLGQRKADAATLRLTALKSARLLRISFEVFGRFLDELPSLHLACAKHEAQRHMDFSNRCFELATLDVRARVLAELRRLAESGVRCGASAIINDPPTHATLAALLGASREVVTRHLNHLEKEGLVSIKRGYIAVHDWAPMHGDDARPARATDRRASKAGR